MHRLILQASSQKRKTRWEKKNARETHGPWSVRVNSFCSQAGIKYFGIKLNLLGPLIQGGHSKFGSDW